jgi:hypothetical protein
MHSSLPTINKYLSMKEEDIPKDIDSAREHQHKVAVYTREQKIAYVRKLSDKGYTRTVDALRVFMQKSANIKKM